MTFADRAAYRRTITGFSNPLVKFLRSLREKKHRKREQRFLAEGLRLLTDARECGIVPEMLVMAIGRDPHPLLDALEEAVVAAGGAIVAMDEEINAKVTGNANPTPGSPTSTVPPRRSGWWRRHCAIPAISARCCGPAMRSVRAG